jgi:hypothetical protein
MSETYGFVQCVIDWPTPPAFLMRIGLSTDPSHVAANLMTDFLFLLLLLVSAHPSVHN